MLSSDVRVRISSWWGNMFGIIKHKGAIAIIEPNGKDPSSVDQLQPLCLSHDTDQITYASSLLTREELELLESMLKRNKDIFVWTHSDMLGIHSFVASHKLNISPTLRPVRQKVWHFYPNKQKIIRTEIDKLLAAGFKISQISGLVDQRGDSSEKWWKMASLCLLHQPKW